MLLQHELKLGLLKDRLYGMSVKLFLCVFMSDRYLFIFPFTEILRTAA